MNETQNQTKKTFNSSQFKMTWMRRQTLENQSQNVMIMERLTLLFILAILLPIKCVGQTSNSTTPLMSETTEATTTPPLMTTQLVTTTPPLMTTQPVTTTPPVMTTQPVTLACPDNILSNATEVLYTVPTASDGTSTVSCSPPPGKFEEGETMVVCDVLDSLNATVANCTFSVTVLDTTPPNATFFNCSADILSNKTNVDYVEPVALDGQESLTVTCRPYPPGSSFPEGNTNVVCTASDQAGNVAAKNCTFTVTVDTTPPNATFTNCSGDMLTNNAIVDYDEPTASEGDVSLSVSCDPPSGSKFPENQDTTVVCTASDAAGNVADQNCTFVVTVDTLSPVLDQNTCPSNTSHYADYATNSTYVTWEYPRATDNLDPEPTVTCSPQSNTKFEIGESTVTCIATDAAENVATPPCTFQVIVTELRAPTIDSISNITKETMLITWSSPDVVENFTVEYSGTFQDTETKNTTLPGTEDSYELTSLVPGETYTIKVIAESERAFAESEERKRTTKLNAPTITDATSVGMTSITLQWGAAPNSFVENYTVEYTGIEEDMVLKNMTLGGTELSTTLDELLPGETYTLRVVASSGSVESGEVFAESQEEQETTVPMQVTLEEIDSTVSSITAQWPAPTDPQSPLTPVIEYYIIKCPEGKPEPERVDYSENVEQASCVNLPMAGKKYTMTVESHSGDKNSSRSIQIIALPNGVKLTEGVSTTSSVSASWVFPGGQADGFNISCSEGTPDPEEILIGTTTPSPSYEASCINLPTPGGTYTMTVYVESGGRQSNSSHIQLTALPEAVDTLIIERVFTTEVIISWNVPSSGVFMSFNASYSGGVPKPIEHENGQTSYETSFTGLVPGTEYTFRVVTLSGDKESAEETVIQRTIPSAIIKFVSSTLTKTTITVTWAEVDGNKDGYTVSIDPSEGTLDPREPLDENATFSGLTPGKMYSISVVTLSGNSESASFGEILTTRPDFPGPVSNLVINDVKLHSARVNFEEPTEPNGIITNYLITYSGKWKEETDPEKNQEVTFEQIPFDVTNLLAGYTYTFTVQARNEAGLGESTPPKSITTPTIPPPSTNPAKPDDQNASTKPTTTSITARFLDTYFSHSNGELINYTVIIAQEGADANDVKDSPQAWSEVKDMATIPPYQAFSPRSYPFSPVRSGRRKRQASPREEQVVLGIDKCQSPSSGYCNGPLRDDTSYVYLFRVWNEAGYADTVFSNPVKTLNDNSLELGLGLGLTFGILFIVLIVVVLLVIRRRRQLSKGRSSSNYQNEGFEHDLIPVRRKGNTRPVRVEHFPEHYRLMKADSDYLFSEEYEELRPIGRDQAAEGAVLDVNRSKNRFTNILPYDHTRVKMKQVDDEEGSDYINANFMPGYNSPREFIACQGPLPGTEDDMWRLVWEQKVSTVVMVTQLVEKGRVKCHKYWPSQDKPVYFGEILVTLSVEKKLQLWTIREFQLQKGEKIRKVHHYNFTAWPDHGVPENTDGILRFVRNVRNQILQDGRPTLVHCSAGVGRTGTFICLDRLMLHLKEHDYVDVFGIVNEMRMHRNFMVQTEDQYVFIHECLMDILQGRQSNGSSPIYENMAV
ncbi:tyrosine-protein phosphatase 10D-like isoform X2 [Patiria miniata]|uniref:protein-tyrosine-phosphatase n=1 Tax=Patiria miniata TaxID=46514 RepID=A0A914B9Y0_PATMI|nr:tyrosine-protein phosphatase 10D-like isoform X2 [Patiria miniata]